MTERYQACLDELYSMLPMYQRQGKSAFKKDLTNIRALCKKLGNPEKKIKSIHVAGSNGKGSVSHMLSAVLQASGYKTGLYTSPHLKDFTERIRINGEHISEDDVLSFVDSNKNLFEEIKPSFFEVTVAMAFHHFEKEKVDFAIIETGLGGRLDSTNIIHPELSIITNISLEHTEMLGETLGEIALEKAGIIKANTPVVIGESHTETREVFTQKANELRSQIRFADDHYSLSSIKSEPLQTQCFRVTKSAKVIHNRLCTDLIGKYQAKNLLTALMALDQLKRQGMLINEASLGALSRVKSTTGLRGRMEVLKTQPLTIADVAHNEGGIKELLSHIKPLQKGRLRIVFGMVKGKDSKSTLMLFPSDSMFYLCAANQMRAKDPKQLELEALSLRLESKVYESVNDAFEAAQSDARKNDVLLICGSTFVVAEIL